MKLLAVLKLQHDKSINSSNYTLNIAEERINDCIDRFNEIFQLKEKEINDIKRS